MLNALEKFSGGSFLFEWFVGMKQYLEMSV